VGKAKRAHAGIAAHFSVGRMGLSAAKPIIWPRGCLMGFARAQPILRATRLQNAARFSGDNARGRRGSVKVGRTTRSVPMSSINGMD
jgi:hypothetical protein